MKLTAILIAVLAVFVVGSNSSLADQFAVIKKITDAFGAFAVRVDRTVESNASRLGSVVDSYVAQFRKFRDDAAALVRSYVGQTATGAAAVARRYAAGFASIAPVVTATDVRNLLVEARNLGTSIRKQFINDFTANIQGAVRYPKNIIKCLNASTPAIQTGLDNLANRIDSVIAQEESKLEGQLRTLGDQVVAYENALLDNIRAKCSTATCAVDELNAQYDTIMRDVKAFRDQANSYINQAIPDIRSGIQQIIASARAEFDPIRDTINACLKA